MVTNCSFCAIHPRLEEVEVFLHHFDKIVLVIFEGVELKIKFLILGILLAIITIGAVNAADNVTQADNSADDTDLKSDIEEIEDVSSQVNHQDNKYYMFRGDCWTINNNFESSAAITSENSDEFSVTGTFRTENDIVGVYWNSKDPIQHPYISYGNASDYSDVILEFDYEMTGCMDFSSNSVNIVIASNNGETYFLAMNRFTEGNHVTLDFNNLTLLGGNSYFDKNGQQVNVLDETRLNVSNLKYVMLEILPSNFCENNVQYTIMPNTDFTCRISNISVRNGEISNEQPSLAPHQYRICEGYDDICNLNPMRIAKEMRKLGYSEWVDLYIGASYFYEKSGTAGDLITDLNFNHNRTEKMVLDKDEPLNFAFRAWLDCYARELKRNGVDNLIISVSMENLQCPQNWRQMDSSGNFAMTGWAPSTFLVSPCHDDVIPYMQRVSEACLDIVSNNGFKPILQMGETWWWWGENNSSDTVPYFYDASTKAKYLFEYGSDLPVYSSVDSEYDKSSIDWLNQQLCQYSEALRQTVKSDRYDGGIYMALLFTLSVVDADSVPLMMIDANYLKNAYSPDKLDILQIEDYDWVINENPHHNDSYNIGQDLGFSFDRLHYFGGFVQNPEDAEKYWGLIEKSMDDAIERGFKEVFVWAGSQVRRDNKIIGHDEEELLENLSPTAVTAPDYVSVGEIFTIEVHTQKWVNGHLNVYDYNGKFIASGEMTNGSASVDLSSNSVGLNRFYIEFDYFGGQYHLIQDVQVIENSNNVSVSIPDEIEEGSDVEITLKAPESQSAFIYISVDGIAPESHPVEGGEFLKSISGLSSGYHTISIKYDGIYSKTFTVNVGHKTVIEAIDIATQYGSGEKLVITLKDSEGNALKARNISISLNGLDHALTTDDEGNAILAVDMIPGTYNAEISFMGDEGYLSSSGSAKITINKISTQITASGISATYNVAKNLIVTLKDQSGKVLSGQSVIIKLNNRNHYLLTDANGQVRLSVSLPAKRYVARITFAGNEIYSPSNAAVNVIVKKATPKITVSTKKFKVRAKTKKVVVKLKTNKNKAIKKVKVSLKVNKKTYRVKTNSKGVATFKVKLNKKGKYAATFRFGGNSNFKSLSKKFRITVR